MTDECLQAARAATAAPTSMVTGAILAPYETQRRMISSKKGGHLHLGMTGKSTCVY
jgi:hypothetical protein